MTSKVYQLAEAQECIYPACDFCNQCINEEVSHETNTDIWFAIINKKEFNGLPKDQMINLGVNILIDDFTNTLFFIYKMEQKFYLVL